VKYYTYCNLDRNTDCQRDAQGEEVIDAVNEYVRTAIQGEEGTPFNGKWVLVVHWDHVHPSPHGGDDPGGDDLDLVSNSF